MKDIRTLAIEEARLTQIRNRRLSNARAYTDYTTNQMVLGAVIDVQNLLVAVDAFKAAIQEEVDLCFCEEPHECRRCIRLQTVLGTKP